MNDTLQTAAASPAHARRNARRGAPARVVGVRIHVLLLAAACGGCAAVGPDFHRPPVAAVDAAPQDRYGREVPQTTVSAAGAGGAVQGFAFGSEVSGQWWKALGSPGVDRLVDAALQHNPSIDSARAALRQAQENVKAQVGQFYPNFQASYSPSRQRNAVGTISPTLTSGDPLYTLHTAQISVGFVPDVFGLNRRTVESLQAQADTQKFQIDAAITTLATTVVSTAVQQASLADQIASTEEIIKDNTHILDVLKHQAAAGGASGLDLAAQETALAQALETLPPLKRQLEQTRDQMAVLVGRLPSEGSNGEFALDQFRLPDTLPVSLPSRLIEQRPDIRAAEAQVHAASAAIGIAVANRLPQFSLTGAFGGTSTQFGQMFSSGNTFWALVGNVSQTLYDFGTLKARERAAQAGFEQAVAQYHSTVLTAFQEVADVLYAIDYDAKGYSAALDAETAARKSYDLTRRQADFGFVNVVALLQAEQAYEQARLARIQAYATRLADTAALFQALGGGWWSPDAPPDVEPARTARK